MYGDLVGPNWTVAIRGMCAISTPLLSSVKRQKLSKRLSVRAPVCMCVCFSVPVHAWEQWVGVTPRGRTITTHLPATIAAYMSAEQAAKNSVDALIAVSHSAACYRADHHKDTLLFWTHVNHHENRGEEKRMWFVCFIVNMRILNLNINHLEVIFFLCVT